MTQSLKMSTWICIAVTALLKGCMYSHLPVICHTNSLTAKAFSMLIKSLWPVLLSGFWTLCSLFFPYRSWVSIFSYFSVLVKLIWLLLAPVLVLLDYVLCVYKAWVLPESLFVQSYFILYYLYQIFRFIKTKKSFLLEVSCILPSTHTVTTIDTLLNIIYSKILLNS